MKKLAVAFGVFLISVMSTICVSAEIVNVKTGTATSIDFDTETGYVVACRGGEELSFEQMYYGAELYSVDIPEVIEGKTVIGIGNDVFKGKKSIGRVFMPDTIEHIGDKAFYYSSVSATTVVDGFVMPTGLKTLGDKVFSNSAVVKVVFTSGVENIPDDTFSACSKLSGVVFADGVVNIGDNAFSGCSGLVDVKFSDTVKTIGENAFKGCSKLQMVTIPASVTELGRTCFNGCTHLKKVVYNASADVAYGAFNSCGELEEVVLSNNVKVIGADAFLNCNKLESIVLPDGLEVIGDGAFKNTNIGDVKIPAGVNEMMKTSFEGTPWWNKKQGEIIINNIYIDHTNAQGDVYIPAGVKKIAACAFENKTTVENVFIPATVVEIRSSAFKNCVAIKKLEIPESVKTLGDGMFSGCVALEEVKLPSQMSEIPNAMFFGCSSLADYEISQRITKIGANAFNGCSKLENLILPLGLKNVGERAFEGTGITELTIPEGVEALGQTFCDSDVLVKVYKDTYAHQFAVENGYNYEVIVPSVPVNNLAINEITQKYVVITFEETYSDNVCVEISYDGGLTWTEAKTFDVIDAETTQVRVEFDVYDAQCIIRLLVADGYKSGYSNAVSFTTPALIYEDGSVFNFDKTFGKIRFYNGSNEGVLMIPETINGATVRSIGADAIGGNYVFYGSRFKVVVMPSGMRKIQTGAFQYCHKLTEVIFNKDIETIEEGAFSNCNNVKFICYRYSAAYDYAVANNIPYELIEVVESPVNNLSVSGVYENSIGVTFPKLYGAEKIIMGIRPADGYDWTYYYDCPLNATEYWFYDLEYETKYYIQMFVTGGEMRGTSNVTEETTGEKPFEFEFDEKSGSIIRYNGYDANVVIPSEINKVAVRRIDDEAFNKTAFVKTIVLPETLEEIGYRAFRDCGIKNVVIPSSVTLIDTEAFAECAELNRVFFEGSCPEEMGNNVFYNCAKDLQIIYTKEATGFENGIDGQDCINLNEKTAIIMTPEISGVKYEKENYTFSVTTPILIDEEKVTSGAVYIAIFNAEGNMVAGERVDIDKIKDHKTDFAHEFSLPDYLVEECTVRVFFWDADEKLIPFTEKSEILVYMDSYVGNDK